MRLQRIITLSKRALLQFRHDRRTLAFILIMPLLMILIFGYTFGGDVSNVNVEIVNKDKGILLSSVTNGLFINGLMLADNITTHLDTEILSLHSTNDVYLARQ